MGLISDILAKTGSTKLETPVYRINKEMIASKSDRALLEVIQSPMNKLANKEELTKEERKILRDSFRKLQHRGILKIIRTVEGLE